jgi:iron complex transport system substrate-binding protein
LNKTVFGLLLICISVVGFGESKIDGLGCKAPHRIVTLAPSLAEVVVDLFEGDDSKIVGVSEYTDFPQKLKTKPSVGPYIKVQLEQVVKAKPDLILATKDGNDETQVNRLKKLGFNVVTVSTLNLSDVSKSILMIGNAVCKEEVAKKRIHFLENRLTELRNKAVKRKEVKKIAIQIGDDPLVMAGGNSFVSEVFAVVGLHNVYQNEAKSYPRPSREDVLLKKPDQIVFLDLDGKPEIFEAARNKWKTLGVASIIFRGDEVVRPSMRLLSGLEKLEKTIWAEVN